VAEPVPPNPVNVAFGMIPPESVGGVVKKIRLPPADARPRLVVPTKFNVLFAATAVRLVNRTVLVPAPPSITLIVLEFALPETPPVTDSVPKLNVLPDAFVVRLTVAPPAVPLFERVRFVDRPTRSVRFVIELSRLSAPLRPTVTAPSSGIRPLPLRFTVPPRAPIVHVPAKVLVPPNVSAPAPAFVRAIVVVVVPPEPPDPPSPPFRNTLNPCVSIVEAENNCGGVENVRSAAAWSVPNMINGPVPS
jgi:hypothetical protein